MKETKAFNIIEPEMKTMSCTLLAGLIVGVIIAKILPNPLFWIEDKWEEYKERKK